MHETGFAQSWSIGASLGLKIFHCTPVVCEDFSRMLISRSPRVRLIMQPSLLVGSQISYLASQINILSMPTHILHLLASTAPN